MWRLSIVVLAACYGGVPGPDQTARLPASPRPSAADAPAFHGQILDRTWTVSKRGDACSAEAQCASAPCAATSYACPAGVALPITIVTAGDGCAISGRPGQRMPCPD